MGTIKLRNTNIGWNNTNYKKVPDSTLGKFLQIVKIHLFQLWTVSGLGEIIQNVKLYPSQITRIVKEDQLCQEWVVPFHQHLNSLCQRGIWLLKFCLKKNRIPCSSELFFQSVAILEVLKNSEPFWQELVSTFHLRFWHSLIVLLLFWV